MIAHIKLVDKAISKYTFATYQKDNKFFEGCHKDH